MAQNIWVKENIGLNIIDRREKLLINQDVEKGGKETKFKVFEG